MSALDAFRVTGTDDPADQVSVDEWNNLLTAIENGTSLTAYRATGTDHPAKQVSVSKWNALISAIQPGASLSAFRVTGDDASKQISGTVWNAFLDAVEALLAVEQSYVGPVATGCRMPDWVIGNTGGPNPRIRSRSSHFTTEAISGAAVIGIPTFMVNLNCGDMGEHSGDGAASWTQVNSKQTCVIEYPEGVVHAVATLSGDETFVIVPDTGVVDLAATLDIPSGAQFWVNRSFENADGSVPAKLPICFYSGEGDFAVHGNAVDNDNSGGVVDPHTLYDFVDAFNVFSTPPAYICAATTKRTFALVGNSRTQGAQDTLATTTYGDVGQMSRAFSEQGLASLNMGYGNDSISDWLASHTYRLAVLANVTDVIVGDPTNDFGRVGHSAVQTIADYEAFAALVKAAYPTIRIYAITSPPIATTSSDGFTTVANQTVDTSFNDKLVIFNTAVRAGLAGYDGYFEVGDILAASRDNGIWRVIGGEATTADGVHENPLGNQTIADSGVFDLVVPSVTLATLGGTFTLGEDAIAGDVAGAITGRTTGSALSLTDTAGGRVALSGTNIVRGATALDYETNTSHSFTVRESHADASNRPHDTVLTLNVTDVVIGPNLVQNSDFATDTIWDKGTNTTISGGKAVIAGQPTGEFALGQDGFSFSLSVTYRVSITLSGYVGGTLILRLGNNSLNNQALPGADGTYTYDITPGSIATQDISLYTFGTTTVNVDDFTVQQLY